MDTAAFATWLGGIGLLDPAQRAEAFRELALAEGDDAIHPSAPAIDAAVPPYKAAVAPSLPAAETNERSPRKTCCRRSGGVGLRALAVRTAVGMTSSVGQGWRQAPVPLHELPEDIQPADWDAVVRLASPGSLA